MVLSNGESAGSDPDTEPQDDQPEEEEGDGASPGKLLSNTRNTSAVRTPCQGVVECVEQECVVAMHASD